MGTLNPMPNHFYIPIQRISQSIYIQINCNCNRYICTLLQYKVGVWCKTLRGWHLILGRRQQEACLTILQGDHSLDT